MAQVDRQKLRALIGGSGRSARAISLAAGLGATAVKDILSGKSRDPGAGTLAAVAAELQLEVADLLEAPTSGPGSPLTKVRLAPRLLGVRYRVQAGLWFEVDTDEPPESIELPVAPNPKFAAFPQWLEKVEGDSADLRLAPGDYAHVVDACELGYAPKHGDWVVVERRRDQGAVRERTIKQIEIAECGQVRLMPRSRNPKWSEPLTLTAGARNPNDVEVQIVGLVIGSYSAF